MCSSEGRADSVTGGHYGFANRYHRQEGGALPDKSALSVACLVNGVAAPGSGHNHRIPTLLRLRSKALLPKHATADST